MPAPHVPRTDTATGEPAAASHVATSPGAAIRTVGWAVAPAPTDSGPLAAAASPGNVSNSRSRSTRNCRASNTSWTSVRSNCWRSVSASATGRGTSLTSSVSARLVSIWPMWARSASPTFPVTSFAWLMSSPRLPYVLIHLVAVFSPTLGTEGRLSLGSPRRAAKSGYCAGVSPYFSSTAAGVIRARSDTPLRG